MRALKLLIFIWLNCTLLNAQNEFRIWYFGQQAGLDFLTSPPTTLTNGVLNTSEACGVMCDNTGGLLFYTTGTYVVDKTHAVMANGTGLNGNFSTTQLAIVKQPGNNTNYYIFTADATGASFGLRYSVVDMSLAAGLGSVTAKNVLLHTPTCEKVVVARHCNGEDVWVVSHDYSSNQFRCFLLTSAGVNTTAVVSAIGQTVSNPFGAMGQLKVSPDGRKLATATHSASTTNNSEMGFHLFDFDPATGVVSNSLALSNIIYAYGMEFSPDGRKLYGTTAPSNINIPSQLFQWDVCQTSSAAIVASQYSVGAPFASGAVQWAIDGKLYVAVSPTVSTTQSISVIQNPNASGAAMGFAPLSVSTAPKIPRSGLPNFINQYQRPSPQPFSSNIACLSASFSAPAAATTTVGCSQNAFSYTGYAWDFGEPASGAANTSNLQSPTHKYMGLGTYTVKAVLYSPCNNDTVIKVVNITAPGPSVTVSGVFNICKGDKRVYTAAGASSYQWGGNITGTSASLSPTATTVYTVSGTAAGCTNSKTFTVTVNECLGFSEKTAGSQISVFPQPFSSELMIESTEQGTLALFDLNSKQVLAASFSEGLSKLYTSLLSPGVYIMQVRTSQGVELRKLVKVE
jgi:hypothetical protein